MARRSSLLLLAVLTQLLGPKAVESPLDVVMRVRSRAETITILRSPGVGTHLNLQGPPAATCTMRVMPADPSIDQKMLKKPDTTKDYTLQVVPPPCQASHPAQLR